MTLTEKRKAFLDETIAFYNSSNRGITPSGGCRYYHKGTPGCAIGRKIKDKELCKRLDNGIIGSGVNVDEVFTQLPDDLKELGKDFLQAVQSLHDTASYWNNEGLSLYGISQADIIRRSFNLI